ncbi:hypothetical protein CQA53_05915 [Helicobacter didelphidarum]|uniref:Uncharacterized protein n=1 Tax=Helicobacter didelphidarum TaxID=2040648 RepID=A0A3D8ILB7_9HELI|nr:hypothetical protein CQA53_05915 [Helicobacter didelphidarum]
MRIFRDRFSKFIDCEIFQKLKVFKNLALLHTTILLIIEILAWLPKKFLYSQYRILIILELKSNKRI